MQRWRTEHARVTHDDVAINLRRGRVLCPLIAALSLAGVLVLAAQLLNDPPEPVARWKWALLLAQFTMAAVMGVFAYLAYLLRDAHRAASTRWATWLCIASGMGISAVIAAVDQWVTASITPYLLACLLVAIAVYLRPTASAALFALAYAVFFVAVGMTQSNPEQLLSNRLNGFVATAMAWALSVLLWRNFVTITLQTAQLVKAHAELQRRQRDLERLTRLDGLTGLYNRRTFEELTQLELDRAQRQGGATSVLLMDLDHFKRVNDTWGHPAGDAVLQHTATIVNRAVRSTDLVGRLGGEEFIILLPATSVASARLLAEKVRARLEASPARFEGVSIAVTASIGLAGTTAPEKRSFKMLYDEADKALYLAMQRGRNRVM